MRHRSKNLELFRKDQLVMPGAFESNPTTPDTSVHVPLVSFETGEEGNIVLLSVCFISSFLKKRAGRKNWAIFLHCGNYVASSLRQSIIGLLVFLLDVLRRRYLGELTFVSSNPRVSGSGVI